MNLLLLLSLSLASAADAPAVKRVSAEGSAIGSRQKAEGAARAALAQQLRAVPVPEDKIPALAAAAPAVLACLPAVTCTARVQAAKGKGKTARTNSGTAFVIISTTPLAALPVEPSETAAKEACRKAAIKDARGPQAFKKARLDKIKAVPTEACTATVTVEKEMLWQALGVIPPKPEEPIVVSKLKATAKRDYLTVTWKTSRAAFGSLEVELPPGEPCADVGAELEGSASKGHDLRVTGLCPNSDYKVRAVSVLTLSPGDESKVVSETLTVHTKK